MAGADQASDQVELVKDKVKTVAGDVLGDAKLQAEGRGGQVIDRLQAAYDQRLGEISDRLAQVETFVKAQPWAALAMAAAGGLVVGRLTAKRKIVYVHRVKPTEGK